MNSAAPDPLVAIRSRIDAIDEAMHELLIERSGVIDELIRIKGTARAGAAFRPEREAEMMRRIAVRHHGNLPLTAVEHIWREIITTFTAMQAPFGVTVAPAIDPLALRDVVRFYFGFSVPVSPAESVEAAVARVASPGNELAIVPADVPGRWWTALFDPAGPKILAKLPFMDLPGRPAALPAYVVGPPLTNQPPPDVQVLAGPASAELAGAAISFGGRVAATADGISLVELPAGATPEDLGAAAGMRAAELVACGGFAQPIRILAAKSS